MLLVLTLLGDTYNSSHYCAGLLLTVFHALRVQYAHAVANLNSGYPKYAKVTRVHYFCTIALRLPYTRVSVALCAFTRGLD